jgi:hypothetical protein
LPNAAKIQNWFLLSRVEVVASNAAGAIVAFGDSIADGTRSTPTPIIAGPIISPAGCWGRD